MFFFRNGKSICGMAMLAAVVASGLLGPLLIDHDPLQQSLRQRLLPPAWYTDGTPDYLLGTDQLGRDLSSRIAYGIRISLTIAIASTCLAGLIGTALGLVSGMTSGRLDALIMSATDVQLAFPFIVLALAMLTALGQSTRNLTIVLAIGGWPIYARTVRAQVLSLKEKEFIVAAAAVGVPIWRMIMVHILPNVISSVIVITSLQVGTMVLAESALSFIGLGISPPTPSLGTILSSGRNYATQAWWLSVFPGMVIMVTVLGANLLGDALREFLDPRVRTTAHA